MIRLVLLLCAGMYFAFMVLGEDRGQKRYGLMLADQQTQAASSSPAAPPSPVAADQAVFVPAQPVMTPVDPAPAPVVAPVAQPEPEVLPDPQVPGGQLFTITARSANVRAGPGTGFGVLGNLGQGEQVLVVAEDSPTAGWSRVRLEGDGVEGYVATRLLTQ